ncbi:uncharacterized protein LOC105647792 isoform X2 [Jatropha curcas]|uniref:uncharacterized protein LOC105647792 isoform X1 n=2 Tax=Jatropha curcas TaxID=180498 RepID=UPI001894D30C|nr:uncharacterized protein LOC105647792 isoform X1 [Jatropha curcas]XP_037493902.1 uncharacterized protein LOC105647792 isoform X2 [Jatropha curcas]
MLPFESLSICAEKKAYWSQHRVSTLRSDTGSINSMAYVPPHKRHSLDKERQSPIPETFVPLFKRNLSLKLPETSINRSGKIVYADHAIYRWFAIGLDDDNQFPPYICLKPASVESVGRRSGEKTLVLVNSIEPDEYYEVRENYLTSPWVTIAEKVQQDLLTSFEILKNEMDYPGLEIVKPTLVARFCKILFHGNPQVSLANVEKNQVNETILKRLRSSIYTNIPPSYMELMIDEVVPKIGVDFEQEKEIYHVKLSDNTRPDSTVSCKCSVKTDKKLLLYKVELNQVRRMVTDISCLDRNLDLRLMLCTKRILTSLTVDEMNKIRDLIDSAVLDSDVKGGLRWPLGKATSGNRYSVVGVWHTIAKAYKNPSVRLKVRHADRFDFRTGSGESTREVNLKLKGVVSRLQEQGTESDAVSNVLKDNLRLIWEHFLNCKRFLS